MVTTISKSALSRVIRGLLLGAATWPAMSYAQAVSGNSPVTTATAAATDQLEEIVVTAQKRAENSQTVPVSMTVIRPSELIDAGVHNLQDLPSVAPSLGVSAGGNGQNSSIEIRGVGAFSFSYLTEPDVAIIIDDVPVSSQSQAFSNLSDIAQIEVLRGPQTTLFGKSASAGVINITTKAPTNVLSGEISTAFTTDSQQTVSGSLSGPITDTLSFRVTGATDDFQGNSQNVYDGKWTNGEDVTTVRAKLRWTPTSDLTVDATGSYMNATGSLGLVPVPVSVPATATWSGAGTVASAFSGLTVSRSNSSIANDTDPALNYNIKSGSLKAAYDLGAATLVSVTGYSDYNTYNRNDFDFTPLNVIGALTKGAQNGGLSQVATEETTQFTQELRLVSAPGPFRYVTGLWYAFKHDDYYTLRGPLFPGLGTHTFANYAYTDSSTQYAAYGQSEWDILDNVTLIGGLRANDERIAYNDDNFYKNYLLNGSHSHFVVTGKAGIEYKPIENINLFASYTSGYKGETFDITSSFTPALAAAGPVKPETSTSYEVGVKSQFFDKHLTLNLTAFTTDYTNFQAQTIVPGLGNGFFLANVGSLRTRGLELDGRARISPELSVNFGGNYLNAVITSYPDGQCYYTQTAAQGCITGPSGAFWNLAGKTLPNAPKFKGNIDLAYNNKIPGTDLESVVTGAVRYQSSVNYSLSPDPMTIQPGFAIVNMSVGVQSTEGTLWKASIFVNNLFDQHYYAGLSDNSGFTAANTFGFVPRDFRRYGGIRASYEF
jgi:iron complex outermembrane receptor protein